ncbi:protoporphyrinogen oxidase [Nocardioides sp.]|uniref:protoporphyrinogen oxidase n=1 Tax=Nocardioides sp. TaxID=35761 RepID=UPI003511CF86
MARGGERTIVVGGGIAGLTAAHDLAEAGADVLLLEADGQPGGKLRTGEVAGVGVDVGAEAMLYRHAQGRALAEQLGLPLVHPTSASSRIWTRGELRRLPRSLMGAPVDLDDLAASGVLSDEGLARARAQVVPQLAEGEDASVGDLVAARFGDEVVDRLVEPLLGGVYAGHARRISVRAAVPQLADLVTREHFTLPTPTLQAGGPQPVFATVDGGMGRLPVALDAALRDRPGVEIRYGTRVVGLGRDGDGFVVTTEPGGQERGARVVVATPAPPTARLLGELAPVAAAELAALDYASVVVVTFAFRADDPGVAEALEVGAAGFLVPPVDGRRIKASTFSFAKWDWVRKAGDGLLFLRTSLGRLGEEATVQVPDEQLVAASLADLAEATGLTAVPVDAVVQRWGGGLPQLTVGHPDRVARIRAAVAAVPGLSVCGAVYDGVGIPATIGSAHRAVEEVLA